jgi:hypothetical protein
MLNKIKQALELGETASVPVTLTNDELRWLIGITGKLMQQNEVAREGLNAIFVADGGLYCSEVAQDALARMDEIGGLE